MHLCFSPRFVVACLEPILHGEEPYDCQPSVFSLLLVAHYGQCFYFCVIAQIYEISVFFTEISVFLPPFYEIYKNPVKDFCWWDLGGVCLSVVVVVQW
jgi:hypothetical protein